MGILILGRQTFPYKSVNVISKYQIIDSVSINTLLRFLLSPSLVHLSFTFSEFIVFCTLTCSTSLILASRVLVCCLHEVLTILRIVDSSIWIRLCNLSEINLSMATVLLHSTMIFLPPIICIKHALIPKMDLAPISFLMPLLRLYHHYSYSFCLQSYAKLHISIMNTKTAFPV